MEEDGYKLLQKWFEDIEGLAYYNLRTPELKPEGQSMEYYIGFNAGILYLIDTYRNIFKEALRNKARRSKDETTEE